MFLNKSDYSLFRDEINRRNITRLIHFTPTKNLMGILELGFIYSRQMLENRKKDVVYALDYIQFNDEIRYDDKSYINLTIGRPNTFLFRKFIEAKSHDHSISWCALSVDPKYIYETDTLFSVTNAANKHNRSEIGVTGDFGKFQMMFADTLTVITSSRKMTLNRVGLPENYTTDEQAEVLVKKPIPESDIKAILFPSSKELTEAKAAFSSATFSSLDFDCQKFEIDENVFWK